MALDGSLTSESSLRFLEPVLPAKGNVEIMLLTVVESTDQPNLNTAEQYLSRVISDFKINLNLIESNVNWHVEAIGIKTAEPGRPPSKKHIADAISAFSKSNEIDLIILASNGWSGSDKWLVGPVSEHVIQSTNASVMLVRGDFVTQADNLEVKKILVPLDGSEDAEMAFDYAVEILMKENQQDAEMDIVYVRPPKDGPASNFMRPNFDFRPLFQGNEFSYLSDLVKKNEGNHIRFGITIEHGDPGPKICYLADEMQTQLIVITSHGRGVKSKYNYGKVADDVMHSSPVPVLILRVLNGYAS